MLHTNIFFRSFVRAAAVGVVAAVATGVAQAAVVLKQAPATAPTTTWIAHNVGLLRAGHARRASKAGYPIDGPVGLTVAPNGDLYVANLLGHDVLVYGSNLVQKRASTFSGGLTNPTSVAFDSAGEVYVSNVNPSIVNVYSPQHAYLRSITDHVAYPVSMAVDGLDNLYVDENGASVGVYEGGGYLGDSPLRSSGVNAIAQRSHFSAFVFKDAVTYAYTDSVLVDAVRGGPLVEYIDNINAISAAFDNNENLYVATGVPSIVHVDTNTNANTTLIDLGFVPQAIAVDSVHNHLFVADFTDSAIQVYTLSGAYITALQ